MDNKAKDILIVKRTISIVIVVAVLFTAGFLLGALTAEIKELAPVTDVVATTVPTTQPTTVPETTTTEPTTTAPATTEPTTTEVTTTEATSTTAAETTTEAAESEKETHWLIQMLIDILEFCKQIKDFLISILQSL